jgi:hypothetical protein
VDAHPMKKAPHFRMCDATITILRHASNTGAVKNEGPSEDSELPRKYLI